MRFGVWLPVTLAVVTEWWLDELAHAGREHLDVGYVAHY
jgi:hypothetical protein